MEFRLLGPVEVWSAGRRIELGPVKRRTLLAALLLKVNRPVPVDRLIDLMWTGEPPPRARNAVQGHVSQLRRTLHDAGAADFGVAIDTRPPGYVLHTDPDLVDAHRFARLVGEAKSRPDPEAADLLRQAFGLWHGDVLADQPLADELGGQLSEALRLATEEYADIALRLGHHHALVGELTELAAANPLREGLIARLMTALARAGRQAEAIDWYHRTRRRLADELGIVPGPELAAVFQAVLRAGHGRTDPPRRLTDGRTPATRTR